MKNLIYVFVSSLLLSSCMSGNPENIDSVPEKSNGFVMGTGQTIMLGGNESVEIVKKIDAAWLARDYDTMKSYIADDAKLYHDDGEWVSARFTTAADEVYEEWYYIVDGKLSWYGSAKRGLYSE